MISAIASLLMVFVIESEESGRIDLLHATVVSRGERASLPERTAVATLVQEAERRTGARWQVSQDVPPAGAVILATSKLDEAVGGGRAPESVRKAVSSLKPEGFVLTVDTSRTGRPVVWVAGADARGVLFGIGKLLRTAELTRGSATLDRRIHVVTSPAYPIRGHQLGYRNTANSWDAWDAPQFEQYIRELALFGANCVENIPLQEARPGPHMRFPRKEMNVRMSEICGRYGLDYWVWTPADFDLRDSALRARAIRDHEELYQTCPRLDGVFVPGGDPGNNHPKLVLPFLKDLSASLARYHPRAKIWLSLQQYDAERADAVYQYLDDEKPDWFGGIVCGPSSPSIASTRKRLAHRYPIRHYPDITHNIRAQYPVPWWDPALASTLGREAINPRPRQYAAIHNILAPDTAGFLAYSDGVHDDVNKVVWTALAWDPETPVREILIDYGRLFFGPDVAEQAADGILALEQSWVGPLRLNGGVDANLALWQGLEAEAPRLAEDWRWQMCLLRAAYDAYIRHRLIHESALQEEANARLAEAPKRGAEAAMDAALAVLARADGEPVRPELRRRIEALCESLFRSIRLQTSVSKYRASGFERGAILDFVDHPLNDRWWLEDEIAAIRRLGHESAKLARLERLWAWEHPGPGSFYDDVGNVAKSPHVLVGDITPLGILTGRTPIPGLMWWEQGKSRMKPAWIDAMNWPIAVRYDHLDPGAHYVIRTTGYGTCLPSVDGERVRPTIDGSGIGEFKEFPIPRHLLGDGTLVVTFERPAEQVNWRRASRLAEIWLLKK